MESLKLTNFKAFKDELSVQLDKRNLLLYGENGAGKSSLYTAIKVIFYHDKMDSEITASTPEDQQQQKSDYWSKYNNQIDNQNFEIEFNSSPYLQFNSANYQVFMISLEELKFDGTIHLKDLISKFCFPIDNIDELFTIEFITLLQEDVNKKLEIFNESVKINIEPQDDFAFIVTDINKNVSSKDELREYFNEAKINTILLLVLLGVVEFSKKTNKRKVLVLDDFITSLDASNRTFLIKHILNSFQDTQILIFTHNISFYNLAMYMIKSYMSHTDKWLFANLYEIGNSHKIYFKNLTEKVQDIKNNFEGLASPHTQMDIDLIGNKIRKKFEVLLYEFSKLIMIGAVEDSNKIIDRILNEKPVYYNSANTASDLVDKLQMVLNDGNSYNLKGRLRQKINEFTNNDFPNFRQVIKELKLYQKITLHPLSHGVAAGMTTFTTREIEKSLDLLQKMEDYLRDLVDSNVNVV